MSTVSGAAGAVAGQRQQFADAIWDPADIVEVRYIHRDDKHKPRAKSDWSTPGQLAAIDAAARQREGYGVYVGINPRPGIGKTGNANIRLARCCFVDLDGGCTLDDAKARIDGAGLPEPTVIVSSGHGTHLYWRLQSELTDLRAWKAAQKGLIAKLRSDPCIHNAERVMRLCGSSNNKKADAPIPCELLSCDTALRYEFKTFEFLDREAENQRDRETDETEKRNAISVSPLLCDSVTLTLCNSASLSKTEIDRVVEQLIEATRPKEDGQRNRCIFSFARYLKGMQPYTEAEFPTLKPIVKRWHQASLESMKTKSFVVTWADFKAAWKRIRHLPGRDPIQDALSRADAGEMPLSAAQYADDRSIQRLVAWCRELQRASGPNPFFLACRAVSGAIGISHGQAANVLAMLCDADEGVLELVHAGHRSSNPRERKAARYRYVAADL
jgi:hypothetical protein